MRRFGIVILSLFAGVLGVTILVLGGGYFYLRGSLPTLSGEAVVPTLQAEVSLERDSLGVPIIHAHSLRDAVLAQGFAHGQDRFFQMDLLRRLVAGELAALLGEAALSSDRQYRPYGYRQAAELHLANLDPGDRDLLDAYVEGVNAGLASLNRRPPEYALLRSTPEPWEPVDTLLGFLYFYVTLSTHYREELHLRSLYAMLPRALADFLTPDASRFDAPVAEVSEDDPTGGYRPLPIPGPQVVDLREGAEEGAAGGGREDGDRTRGLSLSSSPPLVTHPEPAGSNAWAARDADGRTLLANDPHLPLSVPGIWYRVELRWGDARAIGVSPPGLPGLFAGMTRTLAWGVTAGLVDQTDLVEVELDPDDPTRYRTPEGWAPLSVREETLGVRDRPSVPLEVRETRWGPILFEGHDSVPLALRSPAFDPGGVTLRQFEILRGGALDDLVRVTRDLGGPGLSILMADAEGRIGWAVSGVLPRREGFTGRLPVSFAEAGTGWNGVRDEEERPVLILEEPGAFHTANQRLLPLPSARELSYWWMPPMRALRIAELVGPETAEAGVEASHALQLDTRSPLHEPLRDLVLAAIPDDPAYPVLDTLRAYLTEWDGTADPDQPHFRVVQRVGSVLMDAVLSPLLEPVREGVPGFRYGWALSHEPALRILEDRPEHLLPDGYADWDAFFVGHLLQAAEALRHGGSRGLATPWGEVNTARIQHPIGQASPALGRFLNLPRDPLAGWSGTIRASGPSYGQSFRMVGSPGDFEGATFQMPGGQSGHPFSPYYRAGHRAWVDGRAAPLAPGPARHTLTLRPGSR